MSLSTLSDVLFRGHCHGVCPHESCFLSVVRGFRNGVIYGAKIRFPHALVMTFLFRDGSLQDKIKAIWQATYTHSRNLAMFVAIFKATVCVLRHLRGKEDGVNHFLGGVVGGWIMWGDDNPINSQINMYILSRIAWGITRTAVKRNWVSTYKYAFPIYAAVIWGFVMYLFDFEKGTLQSSLISSMTYLYHDSNKWPSTTNVIEWFRQSA